MSIQPVVHPSIHPSLSAFPFLSYPSALGEFPTAVVAAPSQRAKKGSFPQTEFPFPSRTVPFLPIGWETIGQVPREQRTLNGGKRHGPYWIPCLALLYVRRTTGILDLDWSVERNRDTCSTMICALQMQKRLDTLSLSHARGAPTACRELGHIIIRTIVTNGSSSSSNGTGANSQTASSSSFDGALRHLPRRRGRGWGRMTGGTVTLLPLDVKVPCMFGSAVYV
ncbi:uncharacterized protein K489DRAFT_13723 [Dissoconium aciculare CBS 342.82]|uniref:Uncharacterized protein n=1 Tax=Dissoconium aciculare CBS 342.82 TaxID=1314786 RepID=A0A6J3MHD6_9PEZI|nr:uncharacterized protein K489DRAFT_13723 [Dissoconium aciculare CBS 342.82]KAF1827361.1 hypothetical protein K489DRAFT_13723 [Dissoconium aciculare CBS 342.82]